MLGRLREANLPLSAPELLALWSEPAGKQAGSYWNCFVLAKLEVCFFFFFSCSCLFFFFFFFLHRSGLRFVLALSIKAVASENSWPALIFNSAAVLRSHRYTVQLVTAPGLPPGGGRPLLRPRVWLAAFAMCTVWPTLGADSCTTCHRAPCPPARPREPHDFTLTWEKPALTSVFTLESEFLQVGGEAGAKRKTKRQEKRFLKTINTGDGSPAVKEQDGMPAEASQQHQCRAGLDPHTSTSRPVCSTLVCNIWTGSLIEKQLLVLQLTKPRRGPSAGLCCEQDSSAPVGGWWNRLLFGNDCTARRKSRQPNNLSKPNDSHPYW